MINLPVPEGSYRLTQKFGERPAYYKKYGMAGHNGYDLAPTSIGQHNVPVFAPHDGTCRVLNDGNVGYGLHVELLSQPYNAEGKRRKSTLAHLDRILVSNGQMINQGDIVGIMGETGDAEGIHLHWTYKIADRNGDSLSKDNGYLGAIPIGHYARKWISATLE